MIDGATVCHAPTSPPHFEFSERERVGYFQLKASPPQSRDTAAFRHTSKERRESLPRFKFSERERVGYFQLKASVSQSVIDHRVYYVNIGPSC